MSRKYLAISNMVTGALLFMITDIYLNSHQQTPYNPTAVAIYDASQILVFIGYFFLFLIVSEGYAQSINWFGISGIFAEICLQLIEILKLSAVSAKFLNSNQNLSDFFRFISSYSYYRFEAYAYGFIAIALLFWGISLYAAKKIPRWSTVGFLLFPFLFPDTYVALSILDYSWHAGQIISKYVEIYYQAWFVFVLSVCYVLPAIGLIYQLRRTKAANN